MKLLLAAKLFVVQQFYQVAIKNDSFCGSILMIRLQQCKDSSVYLYFASVSHPPRICRASNSHLSHLITSHLACISLTVSAHLSVIFRASACHLAARLLSISFTSVTHVPGRALAWDHPRCIYHGSVSHLRSWGSCNCHLHRDGSILELITFCLQRTFVYFALSASHLWRTGRTEHDIFYLLQNCGASA